MRLSRLVPSALLAFTVAATLSGCGNGGGGGGGNTNPVPVTVNIDWPARSRDIMATSSAQSVIIKITGGAVGGGDINFPAHNRPAGTAAVTGDAVTSPADVTQGTHPLVATFYAQTAGTGSVVGTASTNLTVTASGGSSPTVMPSGTIAAVTIAPNQTVGLGQTANLTVTATDAKNNVIAVTPGSIFYQVTNGGSSLSVIGGQLVGSNTPGTATVIATIDGKASAPQTVTVEAIPVPVTVKIDWPARSRDITATSSAQSVVIKITGGAIGGGDLIFPAHNRPAGTAAVTGDAVTSPADVTQGTHPLVATFYAQTAGSGSVVGTASTNLTVTASGGSNPTVSAIGTIADVTIAPNQTVALKQTANLTVTATDAKNNVIAVTPGSIFYQVTSGGSSLSVIGGQLVASNTPGTATVIATIDGKASAPQTVTVAAIIATVAIPAGQFVNTDQTTNVTVTAADAMNNPIAITPSTVTLRVVTGANSLTAGFGEQVTGTATAGTATLTATVGGKTSAVQTVTVAAPKLEMTTGFSSLYGTVRIRVHGVTSTSAPVSVTVGSATSASVSIAFTDSNIPNTESAGNGGGIDFRVPVIPKSAKGTNEFVVTYNGVRLAAKPVTVTDVNPYGVFTLTQLSSPMNISSTQTAFGTFVVDIREDLDPTDTTKQTATHFANLISGALAWKKYTNPNDLTQFTTVTQPYFNGVTFFRVVQAPTNTPFVAQAGSDLSRLLNPGNTNINNTADQPGVTAVNFYDNGLNNVTGSLSWATAGQPPASATTEFFINLTNNSNLDRLYAVFGNITDGLSVVESMQNNVSSADQITPLNPVPQTIVIQSAVLTGKLDSGS